MIGKNITTGHLGFWHTHNQEGKIIVMPKDVTY